MKLKKSLFFGLILCAATATSCAAENIYRELATVERKEKNFDAKYERSEQRQSDMNQNAGDVYCLWDNELNYMWKRLKKILDKETMNALAIEERKWIADKEKKMKEAGAWAEGGSMQPSLEYSTGAASTKKRVYELAKYFPRVPINEELAALTREEERLGAEFEAGDMTQSEMNHYAWEIYKLWDDELSVILGRLESRMTEKQWREVYGLISEWYSNRERKMEEAGAEAEGGTMQPTLECSRGASLTENLVRALAEYLK